jgi:hypothetical protein
VPRASRALAGAPRGQVCHPLWRGDAACVAPTRWVTHTHARKLPACLSADGVMRQLRYSGGGWCWGEQMRGPRARPNSPHLHVPLL